MFPEGFLTLDRIDYDSETYSKKRVLQRLGEMLASGIEELTADDVYTKLLERERLGATALGHGIGLPHARMAGIQEARGAILILHEAVDYDDASDKEPVDLVCGLLVPEEGAQEHLQILARLAEMFNDEPMRNRLRICSDPAKVLADFIAWDEAAANQP